jgi:hypothetical protein
MILAEFENQGKCSKIKNVAPDLGNCTRETFVAARQGPEFFVNGEPRENYSPAGIRPA